MSDKVTGHCGGFICSYADGRRVIEAGFFTESGRLVTIPRDVFDQAIAWIREQEVDPFEERVVNLETLAEPPTGDPA